MKDFIYKNRYFIGGALALAIAGVVAYKSRQKKTETSIKEDFVLGNTTSKEGDLIFSMPISKFSEYPASTKRITIKSLICIRTLFYAIQYGSTKD